jgi:hypothetical protein
MAIPATRSEFKEYCLRKLGKPVIEINVDDDQVEDRIDESLRYYYDYHFDGSEKIYYKHQVTDQNKIDKYITLPENVIGAVRVFPVAQWQGCGPVHNRPDQRLFTNRQTRGYRPYQKRSGALAIGQSG